MKKLNESTIITRVDTVTDEREYEWKGEDDGIILVSDEIVELDRKVSRFDEVINKFDLVMIGHEKERGVYIYKKSKYVEAI